MAQKNSHFIGVPMDLGQSRRGVDMVVGAARGRSAIAPEGTGHTVRTGISPCASRAYGRAIRQ